jgi:S-adenosylmethionine decarboxylase
MGNHNFFEGTEKKVELIVDPSVPSLRSMGDEYWQRIARNARASVLSKISNEHCDAYLLSESSLFVFHHKIVMITCGRTELPNAVLEILRSVPSGKVSFFIYERKNEAFPHVQPTSFFDDVKILNGALPGRAYQFGDEDDHHLYLFHLDRSFAGDPRDVTVELLMYGIPDEVGRLFGPEQGCDTASIRRHTAVDRVIPGFAVDDHLFQPVGYSLNAIDEDQYWAVHVTPERVSSYASFETNYRFDGDFEEIVRRVLQIFRPRSYDLVMFDHAEQSEPSAGEYRLKEHVEHDLDCGYKVRFLSYFRPHSGVRRPLELTI